MSHQRGDDAHLSRMVGWVQEELPGSLTAHDERGGERLEEALRLARAKAAQERPGRGRWMALGFTSCALAAVAFFVWQTHDQPRVGLEGPRAQLTYALEDRAPDSASTRMRFSEGTSFDLERGTRAQVLAVTPEGAHLALQKGLLHAQVTPLPGARWSIDAGPYTVRVTGTAFDLRWDEAKGELDLHLRNGRVIVSGPMAPQGIAMEPHQHLTANVRTEQLRLDNEAHEVQEAPHEAELPPVAAQSALAPRPPTSRASAPALAWRAALRRGDFASVVAAAEKAGLARVLAEKPADELGALADAARYTRRSRLARSVLLAERRRFPGSTAGHEAAFFLGGLAEDRGGASAWDEAARWYRSYLDAEPRGLYVAQASGRLMALLVRLDRKGEAQQAARVYLARDAQGPYAGEARALLAAP